MSVWYRQFDDKHMVRKKKVVHEIEVLFFNG